MSWGQQSDEELMSCFCATLDEALIRTLMERHHGPALGFVQKRVFCRSLAEEIVQDSFLRVVRNRRTFDPTRSFSSWFYAILRNRTIDALRQRQRHESKLEKFAVHTAGLSRCAAPALTSVAPLLQGLRREERELLVDHFVDGMTFPELAEKLGVPPETLKKRAQRAIKKIRRAIASKQASGHYDLPFGLSSF